MEGERAGINFGNHFEGEFTGHKFVSRARATQGDIFLKNVDCTRYVMFYLGGGGGGGSLLSVVCLFVCLLAGVLVSFGVSLSFNYCINKLATNLKSSSQLLFHVAFLSQTHLEIRVVALNRKAKFQFLCR